MSDHMDTPLVPLPEGECAREGCAEPGDQLVFVDGVGQLVCPGHRPAPPVPTPWDEKRDC